MRSQIHLIRHGITDGNLNGWLYGEMDIPLADKGVEKLVELTKEGIYPQDDTADFYTSGMLRAEQTLALIYGQREHKIVEALQEMKFGDFEGRNFKDLESDSAYLEWQEDKTGEASVPGGESAVSFDARVRKGFEEVIAYHRMKELSKRHNGEDANSIIVCHGGTISIIMRACFPDERAGFFNWIPDPGHGYSVEFERGKAKSYIEF